jgi:hypothetical protein
MIFKNIKRVRFNEYKKVRFNEYKKVRFSNYCKIHLISNNNSNNNSYDICDIWYTENELIYFKNSALNEIFNLMKHHKSMTYKYAIKLLYQPNNICYDIDNFE